MPSQSIPPDFPNNNYSSSLAGAQPKIAMIEVDGKYYAEGNTPAMGASRDVRHGQLLGKPIALFLGPVSRR